MKKLRMLPQEAFLTMGKERQHGYLLRVYHAMRTHEVQGVSQWLYFVTLAYFTGSTVEIEGTPDMSIYRHVLLNQILP